MSRRVPGPPGGEPRIYIPSAFENRLDPEPIEVDIMQPTEAERRAIFRTPDSDPISWQQRALKHVVSVRRYTATTGAMIETPEDLWNHGESAIVSELVREIVGLGESEKKTSDAHSGSSDPATRPSNGTADPAEQAARM